VVPERRQAGLAGLAAALMLGSGLGGLAGPGVASATPVCRGWDGTQPPPPVSGDIVHLNDLAVVSACDVWVVGDNSGVHTGGLAQPLIEHWTGGGSWTIVPSFSPGAGRQAELTSVSALSARNIWAVGSFVDGGSGNLILHWDGTSWTREAAGTGIDTQLGDVSALPTGEAWAVGESSILHRDGSGWTKASLPSDPVTLFSVTAVSASSAWAVGLTLTPTFGPVILHWDGSKWTRDRLTSGVDYLTGVSAVSATDAWAAGNTILNDDGTEVAPVTLHWDGTSWTAVAAPSPGTGAQPATGLDGVTALSPTSAWAFGTYTTGGDGTGNPPRASLLLHGNGHSWARIPTPHLGTVDEMTDIAVGPGGTLWTLVDSDGHSTLSVLGVVPDVVKATDANARAALTAAGLAVGAVASRPFCTVPRGSVAVQVPMAGSAATPGSRVSLVKSTGSGGLPCPAPRRSRS
jgi:hypothetical protein